jgi:transposase InsO family protein
MAIFSALFLFFRSLFFSRISLATEILVLRQQLLVLNRTVKRPNLRPRDRLFWVCLSRLWKDWRDALIIVKPDTVIKWHREGFRLYWRWKSKAPIGRQTIDKEIRELIRRISSENPLWGAPRIQSELRLLGLNVTEKTVAKYRVNHAKPPSQTWKTFLANYANQIAAVDFFTIPTINFRVLYCFIVLLHGRRKIVHFNVTTNPTAQWAAQQIIEAFPDDTSPRYLLRDRDSIYGAEFRSRVKGMQIDEVVTAPNSPFQNPYAERVIGSIRRECLDHLIVLNEDHLRRILRSYFNYYHDSRPHQSLERNSPITREIEPPSQGKIIAIPQVGGLHHRYRRAA